MKYYHIVTFGCQMNKSDSEHIAGMLAFNGYQQTQDPAAAEILILNTCAVRSKAERRVYGQLARYQHQRKKLNLKQKIFLAGCMPAYNQEYLKKAYPYLDGFIDLVEARTYPPLREAGKQAWVTIMHGCNNFCSYCIVPYTRGREKSRSVQEILAEIRAIDIKNIEYLCLLGQNVNSYKYRDYNFAKLLEKIMLELPELNKVGFLTSHPKDLSDELIEVIAKYPKIDRELHLPIQSFSDRILKLMNRGYTVDKYLELVERLRCRIPDIKISTDLIVGYPTETAEEFKDMLHKVKELGFFRIISSSYSPRNGTKAAEMKELLTVKEKNERLNKLNEYIKKYTFLFQQ